MSDCCHVCGGEKWVCENHPENPWNDGNPECCGGAGMPCQTCNKKEIPQMPPGSTVIWSRFNDDEEIIQ